MRMQQGARNASGGSIGRAFPPTQRAASVPRAARRVHRGRDPSLTIRRAEATLQTPPGLLSDTPKFIINRKRIPDPALHAAPRGPAGNRRAHSGAHGRFSSRRDAGDEASCTARTGGARPRRRAAPDAARGVTRRSARSAATTCWSVCWSTNWDSTGSTWTRRRTGSSTRFRHAWRRTCSNVSGGLPPARTAIRSRDRATSAGCSTRAACRKWRRAQSPPFCASPRRRRRTPT